MTFCRIICDEMKGDMCGKLYFVFDFVDKVQKGDNL